MEAYLAIFTFVLLFYINSKALIGFRKIKHIKDVAFVSRKKADAPLVSIIIPTLNKAETIEKVINSLLKTRYENYEIIVVNDRSTDNTASILESIDHPQVKSIKIAHLPKDWLGKSHALYAGSKIANGTYLLYIDDRSILEETTISRAVEHMEENHLDHLTTTFSLKDCPLSVKTCQSEITLDSFKTSKPWEARNGQSKSTVGCGPFNMVRTSKYKEVGEHKAIKMCICDDSLLGLIMKWGGAKQDILWGGGFVEVDWYKTLYGFVRGFEKHTFVTMMFSWTITLVFTAMHLIFSVWPMLAILMTDGTTQILNILIVIMRFASYEYLAYVSDIDVKNPIYLVISPFIDIWILWNSAIRYTLENGITWKDTHYSIKDLKQCAFPEFKMRVD
ncbi:MAG: glycosyltransferase family 2 protein [Methylococcales bacterium]|jgi:glycosyltransferase involved in cell wall biosynthesis|nr:glycosyltransferase family 2 protein [Methylococcales bacterium]MBT7410849.1 glycosyltransferase family 2 protein [Methylococcales bacterium]